MSATLNALYFLAYFDVDKCGVQRTKTVNMLKKNAWAITRDMKLSKTFY